MSIPASKNGYAPDFSGTSHLYSVNANQKNIGICRTRLVADLVNLATDQVIIVHDLLESVAAIAQGLLAKGIFASSIRPAPVTSIK